MTHITHSAHQPPSHIWDQKKSIKQFQESYITKFDMDDAAIDLRTMAENYPHGIIPLEDIHKGLVAIFGPTYNPLSHQMYDPTSNAGFSPKLAYVNWDELYLYSIFQRDVAANHVAKLKKDWDHSAVLVPCAIKFTWDKKVYHCVWDGHHTLQTARMMNYTQFPIWLIDIDSVADSVVVNAGFTNDEEGRIKYGCWLAGKNMIRINATNKRPLAHYDKFMILLETNDAKSIAMNQIINITGCVAKRSQKSAGSWTQINSGEECYDLLQTTGMPSQGMFWRHALEFHRKVWPMAALELEVFRPMSYLYQAINIGGYAVDAKLDAELEEIFTRLYGDAESTQREIKLSYDHAIANSLGHGQLLKTGREIVMAGMINLYNQRCGRLMLPPAVYVWKV